MNRRDFVRKTACLLAGAMTAPYAAKTLDAATKRPKFKVRFDGKPKFNPVVFKVVDLPATVYLSSDIKNMLAEGDNLGRVLAAIESKFL